MPAAGGKRAAVRGAVLGGSLMLAPTKMKCTVAIYSHGWVVWLCCSQFSVGVRWRAPCSHASSVMPAQRSLVPSNRFYSSVCSCAQLWSSRSATGSAGEGFEDPGELKRLLGDGGGVDGDVGLRRVPLVATHRPEGGPPQPGGGLGPGADLQAGGGGVRERRKGRLSRQPHAGRAPTY